MKRDKRGVLYNEFGYGFGVPAEIEITARCSVCGNVTKTAFPTQCLTEDEIRTKSITGPCPDCEGKANGPMNQNLACFL